MRRWLSRLYNLTPYTNAIERRQAGVAYVVVTFGFLIGLAMLIFLAFRPDAVMQSDTVLIVNIIGLTGTLLLWRLLHEGRLAVVRGALLVGGYMVTFLPPIGRGWGTLGGLLTPMMLIAATALLANARSVILATIASIAGFAIVIMSIQGTAGAKAGIADLLSLSLITAAIGALNYILARGWQHRLTATEATVQRLRMTELSTEVTRRIFRRVDLDTLLTETVELVREHFDEIYHAQIFLIDENSKFAVLRASTGPVGRELLRRGHRLAVGSRSVIGQVTAKGEPVFARDTSTDPVHRQNELLPDTRAELALPMFSGERIIGALDVQSVHPNPFTPDDISVLQTLANQIAVAIDNAYLFAQQQQVIARNQELLAQSHAQLRQIQELNQRLTGQAWSAYIRSQELAPAVTVDFNSGTSTPNAEWTPGLAKAADAAQLVTDEDDERHMVAVPLIIRGQVVGAMEFELDADKDLDAEQQALVQDVAERLSLSLESTRLFEEAQRLARREVLINEIGTRLQSASGVENTLAVAAQGLQTALNAPRIAIRLGEPPAANGSRDGHENGEADA